MLNVKVLGAGSIGNHMSHAARSLGWSVTLCDNDLAALERTRTSIYPGRYGKWDDAIRLCEAKDAPKGGFDLIIIGTPPDSHMALARAAVAEKPEALLVEKPLCMPDLGGAQDLFDLVRSTGVKAFVGYDHVIGKASQAAAYALSSKEIGNVVTIDVEFREYWGGIFAAHPWLEGPWDTYLGYWQRGGGASGEHSHATNLWQHFAHVAGAGRVCEVSAMLDFMNDGRVDYDRLCIANFKTESGLIGRVVQDVVTMPPRKWARIQGNNGFLEWHCGFEPGCDAVIRRGAKGDAETIRFHKTRPQDFIQELEHIHKVMQGAPMPADLSIERGLDTMLVVAAMHRSARTGRSVRIDYKQGYSPEALQTV
jgi:predicted dehydrogenase